MTSLHKSVEVLQRLVSFPSVSSNSNRDVSDAVSELLESLQFDIETTRYLDESGVEKVNLLARRDPLGPSTSPAPAGLAYFCHTDVVPAVGWVGPGGDPFAAIVENDRLYARGACDMKGSLAAMLEATANVERAAQRAPLWIVCTADEEVCFGGAKHLVKHSDGYRRLVDTQPLAVIGEPTRLSVVHAHKGIVGFEIISRGRAAHSSTKDGVNANEAMVPMLQTLAEISAKTKTDSTYLDTRFDPPTLSWNFGVSDGSTAINITPERSVAWVCLRPMPDINGEDLIELAEQRAMSLGLEFKLIEGGGPFWVDAEADCIQEVCQIAGGSPRTVCYGTDGGEFTELKNRVVWGPGDIEQAHTTDEWIELSQLQKGTEMYEAAIRRWCT